MAGGTTYANSWAVSVNQRLRSRPSKKDWVLVRYPSPKSVPSADRNPIADERCSDAGSAAR